MCGLMAVCSRSISLTSFETAFDPLHKRGPDAKRIEMIEEGIMGFYRLAIMDLSEAGMQPMKLNQSIGICNGEIYNYKELKQQFSSYHFHSGSDCEVLPALWEVYKEKMFQMLDGEFALVIYDGKLKQWIAARDPMGIRPLFYGKLKQDGKLAFASEMKALHPLCEEIRPFPPGTYCINGIFVKYHDCASYRQPIRETTIEAICKGIRTRLEHAVAKRLHSDAPVGFLLSGGLDSSLVCSIAAKQSKEPLRTFAIGMKKDAIDLRYARIAADFIGSRHTEFLMDKEEVISVLKELIYQLETYDITTIRASLGMYLLCKKIHETTDIKVLMSGEIADELFGYKYTDFAPDAYSFQKESEKRIRELYMYDVLRADRCISAHALEARVPFSDQDLIAYVMSIDSELKLNRYGIGKYLLRNAFTDQDLPDIIRMREKAAFSDAVGHSLVDDVKEYAEAYYTDQQFQKKCEAYGYAKPFTKESLLYREIFESFYPNRADVIAGFWMPNREWPHCNVNDPSARVLQNYGNSGK